MGAQKLPSLKAANAGDTAYSYQIQDVLDNALCSTLPVGTQRLDQELEGSLVPETMRSGFQKNTDTLDMSLSASMPQTMVSVRPDFEWTNLSEDPATLTASDFAPKATVRSAAVRTGAK